VCPVRHFLANSYLKEKNPVDIADSDNSIMKLKHLIFALVLISAVRSEAQDASAVKYGNEITREGLREFLTILASDALEGRETGKRGQKMAAAFIKAHFEDLGLAGPVNGDYYQPVTLYTSVPGNIYIKSGNRQYANFQEIVYYGSSNSGGEVSLPLIFGGNGSKEHLDQVAVEGKAVLIALKKDDNFRAPVAAARERKAAMILLYHEDESAFTQLAGQFKNFLSGGMLSLKKPEGKSGNAGLFFVSKSVAANLLNTTDEKLVKAANEDIKKKGIAKIKPGTLVYHTAMDVKVLKSDNVLGYLEGSDKKDELIVVTAHYDHIGKKNSGEGDLINNGADDDGSGTVAVMEMAKAFVKAKQEGKGPRRSILFMTVTGEEKGLLGSDFYTQNPVFPLQNTVVNLNIDMVGRSDPQHKDSAPYVYVIGSDKLSTELHSISESVNKLHHNLIFDYTYNDQNHPDRLYYRSDHWNFAKNNIPIIFYFDGIHEDYHKPSDEVDKIDFELLLKRAQTVFYTAWEIANREGRIKPDEAK
jgi:hypothetical protein